MKRLDQRFYEKVNVKLDNSSCWEWNAAINNMGYGVFGLQLDGCNKIKYAHRVAWFLTFGNWPDKNLCHKCDNPKCVRVSHMFEGTQLENMQDCKQKGRNYIRVVSTCKRGHSLDNAYMNQGRKHCRICRRDWKRQARMDGKYKN